jgi:hypothetical protein
MLTLNPTKILGGAPDEEDPSDTEDSHSLRYSNSPRPREYTRYSRGPAARGNILYIPEGEVNY